MKNKLLNIFMFLLFILGIGFLCYPYISNFINTYFQKKDIKQYVHSICEISYEKQNKMLIEAEKFNKSLEEKTLEKNMEEINEQQYNNILKIDNSGVMGYLKIEKINVNLPIYHGTQETTLKNGIGHLAGSSIPCTSKSSHIVLAGHTGFSSAQLLNNLDKLQNEDVFEINVLNYTYKYKVNQIIKVLPDELNELNIEKNKQYATLVTCTPYGINSHRLLVRGELYETVSQSENMQVKENLEISLKETKLNNTVIIICGAITILLLYIL